MKWFETKWICVVTIGCPSENCQLISMYLLELIRDNLSICILVCYALGSFHLLCCTSPHSIKNVCTIGIKFQLFAEWRGLQKYSRLRVSLQKSSSVYKAETVYEGGLKVILLLQVSSHDLEPTFIVLVLICRFAAQIKTNHQTFDT